MASNWISDAWTAARNKLFGPSPEAQVMADVTFAVTQLVNAHDAIQRIVENGQPPPLNLFAAYNDLLATIKEMIAKAAASDSSFKIALPSSLGITGPGVQLMPTVAAWRAQLKTVDVKADPPSNPAVAGFAGINTFSDFGLLPIIVIPIVIAVLGASAAAYGILGGYSKVARLKAETAAKIVEEVTKDPSKAAILAPLLENLPGAKEESSGGVLGGLFSNVKSLIYLGVLGIVLWKGVPILMDYLKRREAAKGAGREFTVEPKRLPAGKEA